MTQVNIYLQDDVARIIKQEAKAENMSVSSYCAMIANDAVRNMIDSDPSYETHESTVEEKTAVDSYRVKLCGKDATLLKKKAKELGVLPADWIRHAIYRKDLKIHYVQLVDLEEMLDQIGRLVSTVEGVATVCISNRSVFPQDVERIRDLLEEITALMKKCVATVLAKRQKAQQKLVEKNEEKL